MKILLSVNGNLKRSSVGFRAQMVKDCCERAGHEVILLSRKSFFFYNIYAEFLNFLKYYFFPKTSFVEHLNKKFDRKVSKKINQNIDVFHSWDILPKSFEKGKSCGVKTIADIQMAPVGKQFYNPNINLIIAPSEYAKKTCLDVGVPEHRIKVIPFGVNTTFFKPADYIIGDYFRVIFVGTLSRRKGVPILLQAWNELNLPRSKLFLCGRAYKECKPFIKKFKKNPTIIYTGHLKDTELVNYYKKACVLVLPSTQEGSAKVTYEALSCGVPVITTKMAGSIVDNYQNGIIISDSIDDLKLALEEMWLLHSRYNAMFRRFCQNARNKVLSYTWEQYALRVVDNYKKDSSD